MINCYTYCIKPRIEYKTYSVKISYYNAIIFDTFYVSDVVYTLSHIILTITHSLRMRKLRFRAFGSLAQGHRADGWRTWDSNSACFQRLCSIHMVRLVCLSIYFLMAKILICLTLWKPVIGNEMSRNLEST